MRTVMNGWILLGIFLLLPGRAGAQDAAFGDLVEKLRDRWDKVDENADWLLMKLGPEPGPAAARLQAFVQDLRHFMPFNVRIAGAVALKRIDAAALEKTLQSPVGMARIAAARALLGGYGFGRIATVKKEVFLRAGLPADAGTSDFLMGLRSKEMRQRSVAAAALRLYRPELHPEDQKERAQALIHALKDRAPAVRWGAAMGLFRLDHRWQDKAYRATVLQALCRVLEDPTPRVRIAAAESINTYFQRPVRKEMLAALKKGLRDENEAAAAQCIRALLTFAEGADLEDVAPTFLALLRTGTSPVLRNQAAMGIGVARAAGEEYVQALIRATRDGHPYVRWGAILALGRLGPKARPALPHLIEMFQKGDRHTRSHVVQWLDSISPDDARAFQTVCRALKDSSADVRFRAWSSLAFGRWTRLAETVPYLIPALKDSNASVRGNAGRLVARLGPAARDTAQALVPLLTDSHRYIQNIARKALLAIGKDAAPRLREALKEAGPARITAVTDVLAHLHGLTCDPYLPLLAAGDREVRLAAVAAVMQLGPEAAAAAPILVDLLQKESEADRPLVAMTLARIGKASLAPIEKALSEPHAPHRTWLAWAAARTAFYSGPDAAGARPMLLKLLEDEREPIQWLALQGLMDTRPEAAELMEWAGRCSDATGTRKQSGKEKQDLLKRLEEPPGVLHLRWIACLAHQGKAAIPRLSEALDHWNPRTRRMAAWALAAMRTDDKAFLLKVIQDAYGLKVLTVEKAGAALPDFERWGRADAVEEKDFRRALPRLLDALSRYRSATVQGALRRVYLVERLLVFRVRYGGTSSRNAVYLAAGDLPGGFLEQAFHHEFSSVLMRCQGIGEERWAACNPKSFKYGYGGHHAIMNARTGSYTPDLFKQGFFTAYACADLENDVNVFSETAMALPFWANAVIDQHPRLAAKRKIWMHFRHCIDPSMREEREAPTSR